MVKRILLKDKKGYTAPAIFFHLHSTKYDATALWEVNEYYPQNKDHDGIRSIDGFLIETKDWEGISKKLHLETESLSGSRSVHDRILVVDPALDLAIRGTAADKQKMFKTGLLSPKFQETMEGIGDRVEIGTNRRLDAIINDVYPLLDARAIRDLVQFQLDAHADFVIPPIVPITSTRQIDRQIDKAMQMIRETHVLMDTVFNRFSDKIDLMNLITINAPVLKPENYNKLIALALTLSPSHIGIRLVNFATGNDSQMKSIMTFLKQLHEAMKINDQVIPLHMINFDHLGYSTFCLGAHTVTMPVGTDPYFYGRAELDDELPEKRGVYYRMEDMAYIRYTDLEHELVENDFKLPCYCELCQKLGTITEAKKAFKDWNLFRRMHEMLARDLEIKQLRETKVPLCRAISDKLARSAKANYLSLIPFEPIITV